MKSVTLIISGGIAAYKALELIRLLRKGGMRVVPVISKGGLEFVTALSVSALAEEKAHTEIFSLTAEMEMGHIRLSRISDLVVVAPASADIIAKAAHGMADDLASTLLLATTSPVLLAPAMNPAMWANQATQSNIAALTKNGCMLAGPASGDTACGEQGTGRMAEPEEIFAAIKNFLATNGPLAGKKVLVTAGPTFEPVDPVRFIGNRSSGKQGYAIAESFIDAGADVTLISGPVALEAPKGARLINVSTADGMHRAVFENLPADIAVCAAAVADWKVKNVADQKIKKDETPSLQLEKNRDILFDLANHKTLRPKLVIGFAAETQNVLEEARAKRQRKNCDWLLANDVSKGVFGADTTTLILVTKDKIESWPEMPKADAAKALVNAVIALKI